MKATVVPEVRRAVLVSTYALEGFELETGVHVQQASRLEDTAKWRALFDPLVAEPASRPQLGTALHDYLMAQHSPDAVATAWREHFALADSTR